MWTQFCRWLGIRLIMYIGARDPDRVQGALPAFRQWDIWPRNPFLNLRVRELIYTYPVLNWCPGVTLTLLGWHIQHKGAGKRSDAREVGSLSSSRGYVEMPPVGRSWTLTLQIGNSANG